jgi:hypothetical protein
MNWKEFALLYPEFVEWIVQKFGPLPEGAIDEEDYNRFKLAYEESHRLWHVN